MSSATGLIVANESNSRKCFLFQRDFSQRDDRDAVSETEKWNGKSRWKKHIIH